MKSIPVLIDRQNGKWHRIYAIQSESNPANLYYIGNSDAGEWGCSCPAWKFHTPRKDCKHITQARAYLNQPGRPALTPQAEPALARIKERAERELDSKPNRASFIELE